ncbi:MAG: hypothetical protein HN368_23945 [Spirochaetales bacterium]|nr:hypothetical protein [Spirochaetales bacterium]
MNTQSFIRKTSYFKATIWFTIFLVILLAAEILGYLAQTDFGNVEVTNVRFENYNGITVRAKLLKPANIDRATLPGIVFVHGYQNNRETSDAYGIELARRGFVVLNIDAVGRGNSGKPGDIDAPDFDPSYGTKSALEYLSSLPCVDPESIGLMGQSLGAEIVYNLALEDSSIKALVISGFAYTGEADFARPSNLLMIIGKWDEFRDRMTGTDDIEKEWMSAPATAAVIDHPNPEIGITYGDFADGSARRVIVPRITHLMESHHRDTIAEALRWMRSSLELESTRWIEPKLQIWPLKEWMTLLALVACFASLLPLGLILIKTPFFSGASMESPIRYAAAGRDFTIPAIINGLVMCLYLPFILILFAIHIYVVPIDRIFPMMMVNGVVWWFLLTNIIGFALFILWYKKASRHGETDLFDLGISYRLDSFSLDSLALLRSVLLAAVLFGYALGLQTALEKIFLIDFRFIFPFASDLTWHRSLLFLIYFPFILVGFLFLQLFIHGRMRRKLRGSFMTTFFAWSGTNILLLIVPLILMLLVQYVPLFINGTILLVGPGGMFVTFLLNLFHMIGVLILVIPVSTWFYRITGRIYTGAVLCALLVTWMFVSSQVIAPIPI